MNQNSPSPSKHIPDCNPYSKPCCEKLQKVFIPSAPEKSSAEKMDDTLLDNIDIQNISVIKGPLYTEENSANQSRKSQYYRIIESSNDEEFHLQSVANDSLD